MANELTAQPFIPPPIMSDATGGLPTSFSPNFQNILDLYKNPVSINPNQPVAGGNNFNLGIQQLAPSTGLRPEIQNALDLIKARGDENKATNVAQAQALAGRRGISGSSTELFGTTQAQLAADKATQDSSSNLLLSNAQREQALQDSRAKAYFDRSNTEASLGAQLGINTANLTNDQITKLSSLTSDEIASLRNMDFGNRQLTLEAMLGQQGLDVSRANIGISQDIAQQQAKYGLISSLGGALLPGFLFGGGGGGGGMLGGLFGGGGAAGAAGAAGGFTPYAPGGLVGPYAYGGAGAAGFVPGPGSLALAGVGSMMLANAADKKLVGGLGQTLGQGLGMLINPVGSQLNKAKDFISNPGKTLENVGKSITSVFPF